MPRYDFIDDRTGEIKELIFSMSEEKVYVDETGYSWRRLFQNPQIAFEGLKVNPFDSSEFVRKTSKGGCLGDLFDRSAELSAKRAQIAGGGDPLAISRQVEKKIALAETRKKAADERKAALKKHREKE